MPENEFRLITRSPQETREFGRLLGQQLQHPLVITLTGTMGSGKTCLVQGIALGLQVPAEYYITSPTFTLINEYPGKHRLFHVDLFRLSAIEELAELGLEDILEGCGVVAIEWAEKLPPDMLAEHIAIELTIRKNDQREIHITARGQKGLYLVKAVAALMVSKKERPRGTSNR